MTDKLYHEYHSHDSKHQFLRYGSPKRMKSLSKKCSFFLYHPVISQGNLPDTLQWNSVLKTKWLWGLNFKCLEKRLLPGGATVFVGGGGAGGLQGGASTFLSLQIISVALLLHIYLTR